MKEIFDVLPDLLIFIPYEDIDLLIKIFSLVYVLVLVLVDFVILKLLFFVSEEDEEAEEIKLKREVFSLSYKIALLFFILVFSIYRILMKRELEPSEEYSFVVFLISFFLLGFVILKFGFLLAKKRFGYEELMFGQGEKVEKSKEKKKESSLAKAAEDEEKNAIMAS